MKLKRTKRKLAWLGLVLALHAPVGCTESEPDTQDWTLYRDDWMVSCDNTVTCRMAGYQQEDYADEAILPIVSVLLVRQAGDHPVAPAYVKLGWDLSGADETVPEPPHPKRVVFWIGEHDHGQVQLQDHGESSLLGRLSKAQTEALIEALRQSGKKDVEITFRTPDGKVRWALSSQGAVEVMRKADEVQGRTGTPTALVDRGSKSLNQLVAPRSMPVIEKAPVPKATAQDKAYFHRITPDVLKALADQVRSWSDDSPFYCDQVVPEQRNEWLDKPPPLEIHTLTSDKLLVSTLCWFAAYNWGDGFWIINRKAPWRPQIITDSANDYEDGVIRNIMKGRGLGDCFNYEEWTWNGQQFVKSAEGGSGMCRGFPGGAWDLPTYVTDVHPAGEKEKKRAAHEHADAPDAKVRALWMRFSAYDDEEDN